MARGRKDMQRSSKASDGGSIPSESTKFCPKCKTVKSISEFYIRRELQTHSYCKPCVNKQTKDRQRDLKAKAVEYKGGKCIDCGVEDHPAIYDFHHLNPDEKEFTIAHRKQYKFNEDIKKELDKCVLLCSNCHRKRHTKY